MDPYTIVAGLVALAAIVAAIFFWDQVKRQKDKVAEVQNEKDAVERKLEEARAKVGSSKKQVKQAQKEKKSDSSSKNEIKEYKQRIHDLKGEVGELQKKLKAYAGKGSTKRAFAEMREELAQALTDAENLKTRAKQAEADLKELRGEIEVPEVKEGQEVTSADLERLRRAHKAEIQDIQRANREEVRMLKAGSRADINALRDKLQPEVKELRGKLKRFGREIEHQKRRASNNDKAYKITQIQLDAALEKLALVDPNVQAPGGYYNPEAEDRVREQAREDEAEVADRNQQEAAKQALANLGVSVDDAPAPPATKAETPTVPKVDTPTAPQVDIVAKTTPEPKSVALGGDDDVLGIIDFGSEGGLEEGWSLDAGEIAGLLTPKKAQPE